MLLTDKQVAILGAGPVGLTMARLLQQKGIDVTVYERDKHPTDRIWGGTLDLHEETGQRAMRKAGLLEYYFALATPMGRLIVDEQGNVLSTVKPAVDSPEINRNQLRNLLVDSLDEKTIVWGKKCTALSEKSGKWLMHFDDKETAIADVVIGANGGMSSVRQYVTDAEPVCTGTFIIQAEIAEPARHCPEFYRLCDGAILMAAYDGNFLIANPRNNGLLTYSIIFSDSDAVRRAGELSFDNAPNVRAFLADRFLGWAALFSRLFQLTTSFWGLPTKTLPLDRPWKTSRPLPITLIGDAAHLMPPFAGQGVNTGLLDALLLADNLTSEKFGSLQAAIDDYERSMMVYATDAQRESGRNEIAMRQPDFSFHKLMR